MEDSINDFIAISGADRSEAQHYLMASNNDLNEAIELFYASQQGTSSTSTAVHSTRNRSTAAKNTATLRSSSEVYSLSSDGEDYDEHVGGVGEQ